MMMAHTLPTEDSDKKYTDIEEAAEAREDDDPHLVEMRQLVADVRCQNIMLGVLLLQWLLFLVFVGHINYEIYENSQEIAQYLLTHVRHHHHGG